MDKSDLNQDYANLVENVVTLGTPVRFDFQLSMDAGKRVGNFCAISMDNDLVQFGGTHPLTLGLYVNTIDGAQEFARLALESLDLGDWLSAWFYAGQSALYYRGAAQLVWSTRLRPGVNNYVFYGGLAPFSRAAHTTVREAGVWSTATNSPGWRCR